jgi:hypothetical protein
VGRARANGIGHQKPNHDGEMVKVATANRRPGDAIRWGGRHLCVSGSFATPTGRGQFSVTDPAGPALPDGAFLLSTRRAKQFTSMVFAGTDALTGAGRDAEFIDRDDGAELGIRDGDTLRPRSAVGTLDGHADSCGSLFAPFRCTGRRGTC